MTTRSTVLAAGTVDTARNVNAYVCPQGVVALWKSTLIAGGWTGTEQEEVRIYISRGPTVVYLNPITVSGTQHYHAEHWVVLEGGDIITIVGPMPSVSYWLSGAELPAV